MDRKNRVILNKPNSLNSKSPTGTDRPVNYRVSISNTENIPDEVVEGICLGFFNKTKQDVKILIEKIGGSGILELGEYPFDIAETKIYEVDRFLKTYMYEVTINMSRVV